MSAEYVAGFLFSSDGKRVALIHKNKPEWQRGKINGIGGKVEPGENPDDAMRREFLEEAGLEIWSWDHCLDLRGRNGEWIVHFFCAYGNPELARSMTDEEVRVFEVSGLPENVIPNLKYLIPLCLDKSLSKPFFLSEI